MIVKDYRVGLAGEALQPRKALQPGENCMRLAKVSFYVVAWLTQNVTVNEKRDHSAQNVHSSYKRL